MTTFITLFDAAATPAQIGAAINALRGAGGRVTQAWGESVLIAEGDANAQAAVQAVNGVAAVSGGGIPNPNALNLSFDALAMALGWNVGQTPIHRQLVADFLETLRTGQVAVLPPAGCNNGGNEPVNVLDLVTGPAAIPSVLGLAPTAAGSLQHPGRRAMVGTIGVAVIQIDGPAGTSAAFTPTEWATALFALSDGLTQLHNRAPSKAHLVFTPQFHHVKLAVQPSSVPLPANPANPAAGAYEAAEKVWRDPALTALGAQVGRAGYRDVVKNSRFLFNIDWGFVFVITKYPAAWPAYAPDYSDVVVSYSMVRDHPGIGIGALPFVSAHEIGHTVGALDEYAPHCSKLHRSGFSGLPNANCEVLIPSPLVRDPLSVPCLMKGGTFDLCASTISHFGWGDIDLDGVLDPFDPDFRPL